MLKKRLLYVNLILFAILFISFLKPQNNVNAATNTITYSVHVQGIRLAK